MKGHKLAGEDKHSYHVQHPDGSHFQVAKAALTTKMHAAIKAMPKSSAPAPHFEKGGDTSLGPNGEPLKTGPYDGSDAGAGAGQAVLDAADAVGSGAKWLGKQVSGAPDAPVEAPTGTGPVASPDQYAGALAPTQTDGVPLADVPAKAGSPTAAMLDDSTAQPGSMLDNPSPDAAQAGPQAAPDQPPQNPLMQGMQGALKAEQDANTAFATAKGKESTDVAKAYQDQLVKQQAIDTIYAQKYQDLDAETTRLKQDVESSRINPSRYFDNMSTGGKVLSIIAAGLGGGGAALAGQPNLAAQAIQEAIKRDIQAQVENLDTKKGLLRTNLEQTHDLDAAKARTYTQMMAVTQAKVNLAAASNGAPMAQAAAQALNAHLAAASIPAMTALAQQQAQQKFMTDSQAVGTAAAGGGGRGGFDDNRFNALATIHPEWNDKLNTERKQFEDDRRTLADADHLFNVAPGLTSYADRLTPGLPAITEKTKQLHALIEPFLDKLTRDTSGRVTPQSIELIKSSLPAAGDSPATIVMKRNTVQDILKKSASYPYLQRFGVVAPVQSSGETAGKYK